MPSRPPPERQSAWLETFPARPLLPGWLKLALIVLAVIAAVAVVSHQWNRLTAWLPWSVESRLDQAERKVTELRADLDTARREAAARSAEAEGNADQVRRVETVHRQVIELREVTDPVIHEARSASDASTPLDPDRAGRLRGHDRSLCELEPAACSGAGAPAPPGGAGTGPDAVPSGDPAAG